MTCTNLIEQRHLTLSCLGIGTSGQLFKSLNTQNGVMLESGCDDIFIRHCLQVLWWCSDQGDDFAVPRTPRMLGGGSLNTVRDVTEQLHSGDIDLASAEASNGYLYPNAIDHCDCLHVFF